MYLFKFSGDTIDCPCTILLIPGKVNIVHSVLAFYQFLQQRLPRLFRDWPGRARCGSPPGPHLISGHSGPLSPIFSEFAMILRSSPWNLGNIPPGPLTPKSAPAQGHKNALTHYFFSLLSWYFVHYFHSISSPTPDNRLSEFYWNSRFSRI